MVAMVTGMCRSVPKEDLFYKLPHKEIILPNTLTSFEKCQINVYRIRLAWNSDTNSKLWHHKWDGVLNWPLYRLSLVGFKVV